jgi:hypothetical protein
LHSFKGFTVLTRQEVIIRIGVEQQQLHAVQKCWWGDGLNRQPVRARRDDKSETAETDFRAAVRRATKLFQNQLRLSRKMGLMGFVKTLGASVMPAIEPDKALYVLDAQRSAASGGIARIGELKNLRC